MAKKRIGTEIRQDQIAEAALEIVRSGGIQSLSVSAVAKKVGIVPSAIYRHFKSKSDIVGAVLELIRTRLQSHFQEVAALDTDALEKLHLLLDRHVGLISANNAIPGMIFSGAVVGGNPEKRRQLYEIIENVIANVSSIVKQGQQEGTIRADLPPENAAVAFLGMIQPAAMIWNLSGGDFDLLHHSRQAWKLFSDAIRDDASP
ncbi:MAG: TetR/AcrR family transcriptional regulator [Desulfobacteraceae bacterium]|nr:TetR/AcrR family transcriptional regulator [Desulfobacteraceae bacterium]